MHNGKEYADKSLKEALLAFSQGKKVLVLTEYDDGSMNIDNMEKYFTENTTFFVEVPANYLLYRNHRSLILLLAI